MHIKVFPTFYFTKDDVKTIINIGIKHGFLGINICWAPREMLRRGFQPLPRGPEDVNV